MGSSTMLLLVYASGNWGVYLDIVVRVEEEEEEKGGRRVEGEGLGSMEGLEWGIGRETRK